MADLWDHIAEINDTYKTQLVAAGSRGKAFRLLRWQTMIFDLDVALGGGYPWGRFVQIYGPESGGKSVQMYKAIAGAQMYCRHCHGLFMPDEETGEEFCLCPPTCVDCGKTFEKMAYDGPPVTEDSAFNWEVIFDKWSCECLVSPPGKKAKKDRIPKVTRRATRARACLFDAEKSFDAEWAGFLGVDCDYLFVCVPEYAEQGIDICDKLLRTKEIDILGIDSVAELTPLKEISSSAEEWQMGLSARLVNKALRRWGASINSFGVQEQKAPTIILINQERANLQGYEAICPGGAGQRYKSAIRVRVNTAKYKYRESGSGENKIKEMRYADMSGFMRKNKTSVPMKQFSFRLYLDDQDGHPAGTTNELATIVDRAIEFDVIEAPKAGIYTCNIVDEDGGTIVDLKWKTKKGIAEYIGQHPSVMWVIRDLAMERALTA